jgi:hypothetical protein
MRTTRALVALTLSACAAAAPAAEEPAPGPDPSVLQETDGEQPREGTSGKKGKVTGPCGTGKVPDGLRESISEKVMLAFERDADLGSYTAEQLSKTSEWTLLVDPGCDLEELEKRLQVQMVSTTLIESTYNVTFPQPYDHVKAVELMESRDEILLCYPQVPHKMQKKGKD